MLKKIILLLIFLGMPFSHAAKNLTGFSFLKIAVDSRAAAMGETFSAITNDGSATYWNPAGLAAAKGNSLVLMHNSWLSDLSHEFIAAQLFSGKHNIAFSLNMLTIPGIELRSDIPSENPDGKVDASNLALGVAYATNVGDNWQVGAQVKYLYEKYYLVSAAGWVLDLGIQKRNLWSGLDWGASVQNLGAMEKLQDEATKLPIMFRTGFAYKMPVQFLSNQPMVAAEVLYASEDIFRFGLGLESFLTKNFIIRIGYVSGSESYNFTTGLGFQISDYSISYAYVPFKYDLGDSHRFSVAFAF